MNERILLIEDDESILLGLEMNLKMEGYQVSLARDGEQAIEEFEETPPDLVILDLMLPAMNGFEVLRAFRRKNSEVPVLVLTARDSQQDKVEGLNLGADDYVTKPFALPELLARINAHLRRARKKNGDAGVIAFGDVRVELDSRRVTRSGAPVEMTAREFDLLVYLARSRERVLARSQILEAVWGDSYEGTERTVDNFVVRLRDKIEGDPSKPVHLQTVRGIGYRFVAGS
jgi:DNA-binding response OmpR family regulator